MPVLMPYANLPKFMQPSAAEILDNFLPTLSGDKDRRLEEVHDRIIENGGFVLIHALKVLGIVELNIPEDNPGVLKIGFLVIRESKRGKGHGTTMLSKIEKEATKITGQNPTRITVSSDDKTAQFYVKNGYSKDSNYGDTFSKIVEKKKKHKY